MIMLMISPTLIGTVVLIGICAQFVSSAPPVPPTLYSFEQSAGPAIREDVIFDLSIIQGGFLQI